MGQQVPAGEQAHALPSLPQWAQFHHPQWAERGQDRGCPSEVGARVVGHFKSTYGWGRPGVKDWSYEVLLSTGEGSWLCRCWLPFTWHLLGPWEGECFWVLICWLPCSFPPAALSKVALEFCLQFLNHCHSSKIHFFSLLRYLVLLSFCPWDVVVPGVSIACSSMCL